MNPSNYDPLALTERDLESGEWCWDCGAHLPEPRWIESADPEPQIKALCKSCWPSCAICEVPLEDAFLAESDELDICEACYERWGESSLPLETRKPMNQNTRDWLTAIILLVAVLTVLNLIGDY